MVVLLMIILSKWILRAMFKVEVDENQRLFDRVDLDAYLSMLKTQEDNNMEVEMLQNALELPSIKSRECMVPRTEIIAVEIETTIEALKERFIASRIYFINCTSEVVVCCKASFIKSTEIKSSRNGYLSTPNRLS